MNVKIQYENHLSTLVLQKQGVGWIKQSDENMEFWAAQAC
jgi:hypothetical protein